MSERVDKEEIDLVKLVKEYATDWKKISLITSLVAIISILYSFSLENIYRAESTIITIERKNSGGAGLLSSMSGSLGALNAFAGLGLSSSDNSQTYIAMLESRKLTKKFINDNGLLQILFSKDWDEETGTWKVEEPPDLMDGYREFDELRNVSYDRQTSLVTFSIEWMDPKLASSWANDFIKMANNEFALEQKAESLKAINYLEEEFKISETLIMKNIITNLIEDQKREIMFTNVKEDFAFKVLDPAVVPKKKIKPVRSRIVILTTILGFFFSLIISFLSRNFYKKD